MPIRLKVLFSLAATVVLLVSVMYIVTKGMFEPRFAALEQARLPRLTREVQDQIEERCRQLGMQLRDWSHWTDAQRFIAGQMPDFAKRNFSPTTLGEMHLSAVAYVNRDGDPKLTLAADENGEPCTIDSVLLNELRPKGRLSQSRTQKTLGLIREGANLYEFAAGPILPTDGNGESAGTCLFARKISDREIARIQATCEQRVEILHLAGEKERSILDECLSQPNRIFSKPESDEWLSAYLPLVDFAGVPVALAHTTMTRDAYVQGQRAVSTFAIELAWTGLLLGGLTFWLFENLVLSRVSKFSRQLNQLANTGDLSRRITLGGSDEMARLARPVNELLESLESTKKALLCEQQRLIINEQRLSMALNATGDGYWDWSRETGLYISPGWSQLLGLQPNGGIFDPQQVFARMDEQDRERFRSATTPVTRGETDVLTVSVRLKNADDEMKWVEIRGQVVARDEHGNPVRIVGLSQDVTERRAAEKALRESRELFRNAFEESATGMTMVSLDGRFLRVNPQLCEITGYSIEEMQMLRFQDITHPDDIGTDVALWDALIRGERRHYSMEKRYIRKDGHIVWVSLNVGVVSDGAGKALYGIGQIQDITQRRRSEDELQAYARRLLVTKEELERRSLELADKTIEAELAKRAAEEASRAKSTFLTHMSHEIRTPMTGILGFADLLLQPGISDDARNRYVETIIRNGQHLLSLMNDILDLSKIEAGKMTFEMIECDPVQIVADVESMVSARASSKNIGLSVNVAADVPRQIRTDPTRLCQVLLNVIGNAVKFTDSGKVNVQVSMVAGASDAQRLRFLISDTGIGMTAAQIDRLFEPFSQADVSTTRRYGGTGLGLAISKRLVEMLGGNITLHSEIGVGTQCCVTIGIGNRARKVEVASPAPKPTARPVKNLCLQGLRILLAEDGPDNQFLIRYYLEQAGATVELAEDGRAAVNKMHLAREMGQTIDLVLMDIQMPEMDGLDATRLLRADGFTVPILALTAHGTLEAREQSLAAGCCDHLIKPIQRDALLTSLAAWVGKSQPNTRLHSNWESDENFRTVLKDYVAELPRQVNQLLDELQRNDLDALRRTVHQIRGSGGGYGFAALSTEAAQVESVLAKKRLDSLADNVDKLIGLIRSVHGYDPLLEKDHVAARAHH